LSAPTAVQANDGITSLNAFAYNGSAWTSTKGGLYVYAAENWTTLANGTYITLRGAAVGGTTVTEWARFQSTGLTISTIQNATTDTDKFLVSDGGAIKYRTGAELLSDLGFTGSPVYGSGTATRLAYWSGTVGASSSTLSSSSALNWDDTNGRLGVGVASPSARLQVTGDGIANTVRFESSSSVNLFTLSDQGLITAFAPATTALSGTTEIIKSTSSFIAPSAGSGSFQPLSIAYTINNTGAQTGTATGIFLSATETALGGMTHNLVNLLVGGVSRFRVSNGGGVTSPNTITGSDFNSTGAFGYACTGNFRLGGGGANIATLYGPTPANFSRLTFAGLDSSCPAMARSTTSLIVTLADATAGASLGVGMASATGVVTSAVLQVDSTTKGFLPPRMNTTQKTNIPAPATGLVVYDTTLNKLAVYTGAAWETVTSA
jgi:hypothetical protein